MRFKIFLLGLVISILVIGILNKISSNGIFEHLRFENTGYRFQFYKPVDAAYERTGVYYVFCDYNDNFKIKPIELSGDDIGIYYYIQLIKNHLKLKEVKTAYFVFFNI